MDLERERAGRGVPTVTYAKNGEAKDGQVNLGYTTETPQGEFTKF